MYCSKCGAQISEKDQFCPKCGQENINYNAAGSESGKNRVLPIAAGVAVVLAGLVCILYFGMNKGNKPAKDNSRISCHPGVVNGYIGVDGSVNFVEGSNVRTIDGKAKRGVLTPDRKRYLVLFESGELKTYVEEESEPELISNKADIIARVLNKGCFFTVQSTESLNYYDFESKETTDTGLSGSECEFSVNGNTVIGLGKNDEVRMYTVGDASSKVLFNAETAETIEDTCCIADDGSNIVWAVKEGNVYNIYMMINDAPERIGKITNAEKYSTISGVYYNNDKSFIVYSSGSSQMILWNDGEVREIALPGVKNFGSFYNTNGEVLYANDDYIEEPYFMVSKTKSSEQGSLYRLLKGGTVQLEADGLNMGSSWSYYFKYCIRNGILYFIDQNNDLCKKKLGEGNEIIPMTTDVQELHVPTDGGYAYIIKAGSLYSIDLSDDNSKLNLVWNKISDDDTIYVTDKTDTVYFITDMEDIPDSYRHKGNLYQYKAGGEAVKIASDVMSVSENGEWDLSADSPTVEQYVSNEKYDFVINLGTLAEGEYKELVSSVKQ